MAKFPNFAETNLEDIWAARQEHKEQQDYGKEGRTHAEGEILRRAAEADATILGTEYGDITITYSQSYAFHTHIVASQFKALVMGDGLGKEWDQFVTLTYKINKNWLNRLGKRGAEYREIIEAMTQARTGSPSLSGPELKDMKGYAPREETDGN